MPIEEQTVPPKERRFKLSRACDRCRRRRIKCDEGHPCQSCLSSHSPCTFEEPGKRTQHSKSKRTATLEDRMHHLETLIQSIPANILEAATRAQQQASIEPALALGPATYPAAVPPPALSMAALTNPSIHFSPSRPVSFASAFEQPPNAQSYMYLDEQGCKRWQGESSGLPLLDLLFDKAVTNPNSASASDAGCDSPSTSLSPSSSDERDHQQAPESEWFPDRGLPRSETVNPETMWRVITSVIPPDLMDTLVQCYLSTSYYLMPFLHIPTFLSDYANPLKWGSPGFASFILSICLLASRHIDDPRIPHESSTPNPTSTSSDADVGAKWFALFNRIRTLPTADKPTLYSVQAVLVAAVYAVGRGRLSRAFALLAEAVTLSFDAGLHRSTEAYESFGRIEEQVRARTWWCVYMWDKQAAAAFGRPVIVRLRDCDVGEPWVVDDEYISSSGEGEEEVAQPEGVPSRMGAFVATLRAYIALEAVLDRPPAPAGDQSTFLSQARAAFTAVQPRQSQEQQLALAESLLDSLLTTLPPHWAHTPETLASEDVVRVTQAVRIHCLERFVRLLVWRARWAGCMPGGGGSGTDEMTYVAMRNCVGLSRELVKAYLTTASKGVMTYYGVHVIHQLTQAGRTLVAVLLALSPSHSSQSSHSSYSPQPDHAHSPHPEQIGLDLIPPALEALRSCVSLLRKFSGRYVCGMRNGDLLEEFCRLSGIPLGSRASAAAASNNDSGDAAPSPGSSNGPPTPIMGVGVGPTPGAQGGAAGVFGGSRPPWSRPLKKRARGWSHLPPQHTNSLPSPHTPQPHHDGAGQTYNPAAMTPSASLAPGVLQKDDAAASAFWCSPSPSSLPAHSAHPTQPNANNSAFLSYGGASDHISALLANPTYDAGMNEMEMDVFGPGGMVNLDFELDFEFERGAGDNHVGGGEMDWGMFGLTAGSASTAGMGDVGAAGGTREGRRGTV
ncbi:hypothetical protein M422DRAFT_219387 [Sphaerobolus stellatus SS14]|nr:hypothetical protein M422DRAFT_219387 [Sphaerobolus stellatus SS14]